MSVERKARPLQRRVSLRGARLERWAHLGALWTLAVAGPLFALLGGHPEFFTRYGSLGGAFIGFAVLLALVPPLVLGTIEVGAGLVRASLEWPTHLLFVGLLCAAFVLSQLDSIGTPLAAGTALAGGVGAVLAYTRLPPLRTLASVLAPAPVVFLLLFLLSSDAAGLTSPYDTSDQRAGTGTAAPVVLVIFDEFPVNSLMDGRGRIDRRLYPNFARLAADATWYRNTATVDQDTPYAVPAILDARLPRRERLPVAADHPRNIFTLLDRSHVLHVREDATAICPATLCPRDADRQEPGGSFWHELALVYAHILLPSEESRKVSAVESAWRRLEAGTGTDAAISATSRTRRETKRHRYRRLHANLSDDRPDRFTDFVEDIRGGARPRLHLIHILLPHVPYQYLPSGRRYRRQPNSALPGLDGRPGFGIRFLVQQAYQRHLLQVGATDRLLGILLDRLHQAGIYDRAVVAVVADHGISFRVGHDRRLVRRPNVRDIAPVPFLIKAPGQRQGDVSDKPLRTIDVLPTIADMLGLRIPWDVDGRSALAPTSRAQRDRRIISKKFRHSYPVDTTSYASDRRVALARKLHLFGPDPSRFGPRPDLLGRTVGKLAAGPANQRARFESDQDYLHVDRDGPFVPIHAVGTIAGGVPGGGRVVALAVNGKIAATGLTFSLEVTRAEQYSLILTEPALREGSNRLELLLVRPKGLASL